jgi:integrase/recombinase XerC
MNPRTCSLGQAVDSYLKVRRQWGFALNKDAQMLHQLAGYARQQAHTGPLTSQLVLAWAQQPATAAPSWWARRLAAAQRFARFWAVLDPRTEIPPSGVFGPSASRREVHRYTRQQITQVLEMAATLEPVDSLRPTTFQTLWGLLACTGMRVGEALRLQVADLDAATATLTIRRSKFGCSRSLPLHSSTVVALQTYLQRRQQCFPQAAYPHLLLTWNGRPLSCGQAETAFATIRTRLGWHFTPQPRLYDLRHHFTIQRLLDWYQAGQAHLETQIHTLATYLGHRQIRHTYWYLSAIPELLALANDRAATAFTSGPGGSHA